MSMDIDGGYDIIYGTEISIPYDGMYSRFVSEVMFRGEHDQITEYGIVIKSKWTKFSSYIIFSSLDKHYKTQDIHILSLNYLVYKKIIQYSGQSDIFITPEDITMCIREEKLLKIKEKIKKENSILYKIKKVFKKF